MPKNADVPEREVAGEAAEQVPRGRERGVHHDEDPDVDDPVLAEQERATPRAARRRRARGPRPHASGGRSERTPLDAAEQALRPHDQHRDQHEEEGERRPGGRDLGRQHRLAHAHDERAAMTAPPRLPRPPEHDDREQPRDQVVVAARVEREDDAVDRAGGGGGGDAEAEADRGDALRIDAEQLGRDRVLDRSRAPSARTGCARGSGRAASGSRATSANAVHAHLRR